MYSRKKIDKQKVKKLWWVHSEYRIFFEKNRAKCSCPMCGNPRRHYGSITFQEKRKYIADVNEIEEFFND